MTASSLRCLLTLRMRKGFAGIAAIAAMGCSKTPPTVGSADAAVAVVTIVDSGPPPPPLDVTGLRALVDHPTAHKPTQSVKTPDPFEPSHYYVFTFEDAGANDVQIDYLDHEPTAWSITMLSTPHTAAQFGDVELLNVSKSPVVETSWYRINSGPFAKNYLSMSRSKDGDTSASLSSLAWISRSSELDDKRLGMWLAGHPRDGGN